MQLGFQSGGHWCGFPIEVIFSLFEHSNFESFSKRFETSFESFESGPGFSVTWSRKVRKEIRMFTLEIL